MANWIPRKVLGDAELFARIPAALDAWVRFAGRRSNLPEWAISATCESIPVWRDAMVRLSDDPGAGGPAKQFLSAAQSAGIDLADADALNTFVARVERAQHDRVTTFGPDRRYFPQRRLFCVRTQIGPLFIAELHREDLVRGVLPDERDPVGNQ